MELRLLEWGLAPISGDVLLVVGELVTNAVKNAPDGVVQVRFVRESGGVLFEVWDASDEMPVVRPIIEMTLDDIVPDPLALEDGHEDGTGGRGLPVVRALSSECGVRPTEPCGKWVWARVAF
ncbi:ATP-binding protein [Actinomadura sp. GTD37]|uniref:ATP-binding protein n=1 Tax=Actinomadura sp. GTD37 TaxID=1778030 RepID=UPI0035BEB829